MRDFISSQLTSLGYQVRTATNGPDALRLLDTTFDLLVSDVVLPGGLDGVEVARQFRTAFPALRVLLISGYPTDALPLNGPGKWRLLRKPFRRAQLEETLVQALGEPLASPDRTGALSPTADKYRRMADECLEHAAATDSAASRAEWLRLADEWLSLARRLAPKVIA